MKRKIFKFMAMFLVLIMSMGLLSACGDTKTSNEVESTEENLSTDDVVVNIDESIYDETEHYFVIKDINKADKTLIDGETLKRNGDAIDKTITLKESINLYTFQKSKVGYTKANAECYYESAIGEWSYIIFDDGGFFVLTEELLSVAKGLDNEEIEITETESTVIDSEDNTETSPNVDEEPTYTVTDMTKTMYAKQSVNLRSGPSSDYKKIGSLTTNQEVQVTGQANNGWYRIDYNGGVAFVSNNYLSDTKVEVAPSDDGDDTNEDENNSEEEYTPPTDDDTSDDFWDIVFPEDPEPIYTVDEVISIVRSTLESGGMKWYPDVYPNSEDPTGGMSWGMDWVPMDDPQTYAESLLRGFQYQGFDVYYLEYQYVENNKVVFKTYFSFIPK